MIRLLLAAALAAVFNFGFATAEEHSDCDRPSDVERAYQIVYGEGINVAAEMVGRVAQDFVETWNASALEPLEADRILALSYRGYTGASVHFFVNGCRVAEGKMRLDALMDWIHEQVRGTA